MAPIFDVAGILGLVMAGDRGGPTLQDEQLVGGGHVTLEVCWKGQNMDTHACFHGEGPIDACQAFGNVGNISCSAFYELTASVIVEVFGWVKAH